jgi:hypothetical protein
VRWFDGALAQRTVEATLKALDTLSLTPPPAPPPAAPTPVKTRA